MPARSALSVQRFCPFAAAIFTCIGCAGVESAARWDGTARDSAGITIVENFGSPLWTPEDQWRVSEVLRIGTVSGDPDYQFGVITTLVVQSDGTMVAADRLGQHLKFFSAAGEHVRTVGKPGSGPREFGPGLAVGRARGDTLLVMDWSNIQAHWLAPDGTWLGSWKFTPREGRYVGGWDDSAGGRIVHVMSPLRTPEWAPSDTLDLIVVRDVRGAVLDTLAEVPSSLFFTRSGEDPEWHFYAGDTDFDLTEDGGLVTGRSDRYRLSWYDSVGRLERRATLHRERLPFTDRDASLLMQRLESVLREYDVPPERIGQIKSAVHFEDTYPAYHRFVCGPYGTVWVQHVKPIRSLNEDELKDFDVRADPPPAPDWDVFDREGRYLGIVTLPDRFIFRSFWGDRIYGV